MPAHFVDRAAVKGFDGHFLDRPHHPLRLTVGPRMRWFCQPVFDVVFKSDPLEDVRESGVCTLFPLNKLHAIIRQDCVDPVRDGSNQ